MAKKILITAITGARNHGVEALVVSAVKGLRGVEPDVEIDILTQDSEYDAAFLKDLGVRFLDDVWRSRKNALKRELNARFARYIPALDCRPSLIKGYDLILVSGGDMFGPDYGSFDEDLAPLRAAKKFGIPYIFLGQSVGRLEDIQTRASFTSVASDAAMFLCRESLTYDYMASELGVDESRLELLPDPAFLLEVSEDSSRLRDTIFGDHVTPYVTFSVSKGVSTFSQIDEERHIAAVTRIIDHFSVELGIWVLLLPHVHESYTFNDDSLIAKDLIARTACPERVFVAPAHLSASQYKTLVAESEFLVAERMHMAIAALSTCTPVFCIGYSIKYRGILGDLFGQEHAHLLVSIGDLLTEASVPVPLLEAWGQRAEQAKRLDTVMPGYKADCERQYAKIATYL